MSLKNTSLVSIILLLFEIFLTDLQDLLYVLNELKYGKDGKYFRLHSKCIIKVDPPKKSWSVYLSGLSWSELYK